MKAHTLILGFCVGIGLVLCGVSKAQTPRRLEAIPRDQMVDLVAGSLTASLQHPLAGEQVHLELTILNQSENAARGVGALLFAGTAQIASVTADIAARHKTVVPFTWTPRSAGVYELTAVIDPDRRLVEENRGDNLASLKLAVTDAAQKDAAFSVSDLDLVTVDGHRSIRARIQNPGTAAASAPVILRVQDRVIAVQYISELAPGASTVIEAPYTEPAPATRISAEVNPRFRTSGVAAKDIGLATDLSVEGLSLHCAQFEASRPRRVSISFRIVNAGQTAVTTPFRTRIFPALVKSGALAEDFLTTPRLAPGEAVYVTRTVDSPIGEFDVRVETDVDRTTADQDRANNVATAHFKNPAPDVDRWVAIGPRRIDNEAPLGAVGALFHIAIDPNTPSVIYTAGRGEGIWKTFDGGQNWQPITDALPTLLISAFALDPSDPSRVYAVTQDQGVFRSTDGGGSWNALDTPNFQPDVGGLAILRVHPSNPNIMLLTSNQGVSLYRADASPPKWTVPLNLAPATDLLFDPSTPTRVYATLRAPATGIYLSQDSGNNWSRSLGCPGGSLPATDGVTAITLAFAGTTLYAAFKSDQKFEVYRTTGTSCFVGGQSESSWERRFSLTGLAANDLWNRINADPTNPDFVYISGLNFEVSGDGGANFGIQSGSQPHADHHGFATDPTDPRIIYVVCDGGIYRSSNRGAPDTWQSLGDGIFNVQFYAFSLAETDPTLVIGGTQDNGTLRYTGSTVWDNINGGDGATTAIDPTDPTIQYSMNQGPDSMQKRVGNGPWQCIGCGIPIASSCNNLYFQVNPKAPSTVLASCLSLLKADSPVCTRCPDWSKSDVGEPNVWTPILPQSLAGTVLRSAVDAKANLFYAGTSTGQLWAGPGGANWQLIFSGFGPISDIKIDRDDPATIYVSLGVGRVYRLKRSTDSPTSATTTATDITFNFPGSLNINTIAIDRMNPFTVYAGTNRAVYRGRSADKGVTWNWESYANGFPLADVREMDVHPRTGVLRAATFGRGVYEVNTGIPVGSLLSASGRITFLRVHDVGTGFGPPDDFINGEVVIQLDSLPGQSFGFQLRPDNQEAARNGMLDTLRSAFRANRTVLIDYYRTGVRNGQVIRVAKVN